MTYKRNIMMLTIWLEVQTFINTLLGLRLNNVAFHLLLEIGKLWKKHNSLCIDNETPKQMER